MIVYARRARRAKVELRARLDFCSRPLGHWARRFVEDGRTRPRVALAAQQLILLAEVGAQLGISVALVGPAPACAAGLCYDVVLLRDTQLVVPMRKHAAIAELATFQALLHEVFA